MSKNLVLWGHSLAEYEDMFDLEHADFQKKMLDCNSAPSSFSAQMYQKDLDVVACNALYDLPYSELERAIKELFPVMLNKARHYESDFVWKKIADLDALADQRWRSIQMLLDDYDEGLRDRRYVADVLPSLSFADNQFDLCLSSHNFFMNHDQDNVEQHVASIVECCRVAGELRIFPLLNRNGDIAPIVGPVMLGLQQHALAVEVREVPYELQKGGNAMLRIWQERCAL